MKHDQQLSDEYLNAFVDGELAAAERTQAMEQISNDPQLKKQVCELNMLKEMMRISYRHPTDSKADTRQQRWPYLRHAVAACCLMVIGVMAGWLGHGRLVDDGILKTEMVSLKNAVSRTDHILLHLDTASPAKFERALNQTEKLLDEASEAGQDIQVHLAANSHGIDLFRVSTTPYASRIRELQQRYPNLTLIGCAQTIRRLEESKQNVALLPDVDVVPSVLDEVVSDLKDGWTYLKV
jgi:intracellular sulfur oxidation DsrE/DsrF family protein